MIDEYPSPGTVKRKSLFENGSPEDKRAKSEHHAENTTETNSSDAIDTKAVKECSNQTVSEPKASCSRGSEDVQESGDNLSGEKFYEKFIIIISTGIHARFTRIYTKLSIKRS